MIQIDDTAALREAYADLKAKNGQLGAEIKRRDALIERLKAEVDRVRDELDGTEKLLRIQAAANNQRANEIEANKARHARELERMEESFRIRQIGTAFISFSLALAALGAIYCIVRMKLNGWL